MDGNRSIDDCLCYFLWLRFSIVIAGGRCIWPYCSDSISPDNEPGLYDPGFNVCIFDPVYSGDIECKGQGSGEFCINRAFYDQFEPYLTTHGYGSIVPFPTTSFTMSVNMVFGSKFNSAYYCDNENVLSGAGVVCGSNEVCAAGSAGARCLNKKSDCAGFNPFDQVK